MASDGQRAGRAQRGEPAQPDARHGDHAHQQHQQQDGDPEVGLEDDQQQRQAAAGERERHLQRPRAGGAFVQIAEDHRQHQDHPDLGELGRLDLEPAGQRDPGVRAVDRGAQRAEHHQQPQAGGRVDQRRVHPQYPVVDQADRDQERQADSHVEELLFQVGVRVAARLLQPGPGRRPDEQRADQRECQHRGDQDPVHMPHNGILGQRPCQWPAPFAGPGAAIAAARRADGGEPAVAHHLLPA